MKIILLRVAGCFVVIRRTGADNAECYQLPTGADDDRHTRAPLANNGSVLAQSTPNARLAWDVPGGELTTKRRRAGSL